MTHDSLIPALLSLLGGYVLGCIPVAVIVSKLKGLPDPRSYGSGNPGATNVLRSGNKSAAIITLIADALKGTIAVLMAIALINQGAQPAIAMLGAVLGHVFSVFMNFKGGKGVATAMGALLGYAPWLALAVFLIFVLIMVVFRMVSLASVMAALATIPLLLLAGEILMARSMNVFDTFGITLMAFVVIFRHKANIQRIIKGDEPTFRKK